MRYVYVYSGDGLYTVGFYTPNGEWTPESDHSDIESAARRVHYLNGGVGADDASRDESEEGIEPYSSTEGAEY